jgi:hypothetical protein
MVARNCPPWRGVIAAPTVVIVSTVPDAGVVVIGAARVVSDDG